MAKERLKQHVRLRDDEELKAIENRLVELSRKIREMRLDMKESSMPGVKLATGTFTHFLDKLEPLAERFAGEFRAQKREYEIVASSQRFRQEVKDGERPVQKIKRV